MNGQYFNSSGSGNGTPTPPSNSSYPASLSSQSSRDPSPPSRDMGHQYGYGYEQKSMSHTIANNISNISNFDPNKQLQPLPSGIYPQKVHEQHITNNVRSQGFNVNHNNSTNSTSNFNSMTTTGTSHFNLNPSENKYNALTQNSYNSSAPNVFPDKSQYPTGPSAIPNAVKSDFRTFTAPSYAPPTINTHSSQFSSNSNASSTVLPSSVSSPPNHNVPLTSSGVINTSTSDLSSPYDSTKQTPSYNYENNSPSRYQSLSKESLSAQPINELPRSSNSPPVLLQSTLTKSHSEECMMPNSTETPPPAQNPSQDATVPRTLSTSSVPSSQSMFPPVSVQPQLTNTFRSSDISSAAPVTNASTPVKHSLQNQHVPPSVSPIKSDQRQKAEIGSGEHPSQQFKQPQSSSLDSSQIKSQFPAQINPQVAYTQSQVYPSTTLTNKLPNQAQYNLNQSRSTNSVLQPNPVPTSLPTTQTQFKSQFNTNQQYPPSSIGSNMGVVGQIRPGVTPHPQINSNQPSNVIGPSRLPPSTSTSYPQMPPTSAGLYQQAPPTSAGLYQQTPPTSGGLYQQTPPTNKGLQQQTLPTNIGAYQPKPPTSGFPGSKRILPPTGPGPYQQIPPNSLGSYPQQISPVRTPYPHMQSTSHGPNQQLPPTSSNHQMPLSSTAGNYQQYPPAGSNIGNAAPYSQMNQFQQGPPLANQFPPHQLQGPPIQSQPTNTNSPYKVNRYPQMAHSAAIDTLTNQLRGTSVTSVAQQGFNKLWGMESFDLLKTRDLLPEERIEAPNIRLNPEVYESSNCSPELFRCTLTKIPETKSLLDKSRLPFGVLIHPFKDLNDICAVDATSGQVELPDNSQTQLSVVQCSTIVRCRSCRTYINPFVYFVDNKRWKCNLCFRVNELPDEFQFDPVSKTYGDPSRRPEIKFATIEFIAPSEYMVRPPQPAIYLFLFDVSRLGAESGYLDVVCQTIIEELENLPGDARTSVGFITYDSSVHFYSLAEGLSQPHQMVVVDIDDMFLPCPDNLLVNLNECHDLIKDLLTQLPTKYSESFVTESALGAALQAAYKLLAPTGGRITVFQSRLPSVGPGSLSAREDPSLRAGDSVPHLNPITDFYKKLALDCSSQQIAVDLFVVNSQYVDIATLSGISRFSGGCMYHFPLFRSANGVQVNLLKRTFQRYLTRKIGFESVMRLRCTRGLSIHTFHGHFFVRSTDLLSLPNINPDAGFGMQVSIDESLSELQNVCFQAALLYTSSKGERRIRVHTLCLPVATNLSDIIHGADQYCIIGLLSKMAVDRSIESSLIDAREAFINVVADIFSAYKVTQNSGPSGCLLAPKSLRLVPLFILALLKSIAFRTGQSTRLDDRVFAMCQMKTLPLSLMLQFIYPDLYPVHNISQQPLVESGEDGQVLIPPQRLHLSSDKLDSQGLFLLDNGTMLLIYVGHNINPTLCQNFFGVPHFAALPQEMYELPELNTPESERLRDFVYMLQTEKPIPPCIQVIRDDSPHRGKILEYFVEDKNEAGTSYYEFLQRIKVLVK